MRESKYNDKRRSKSHQILHHVLKTKLTLTCSWLLVTLPKTSLSGLQVGWKLKEVSEIGFHYLVTIYFAPRIQKKGLQAPDMSYLAVPFPNQWCFHRSWGNVQDLKLDCTAHGWWSPAHMVSDLSGCRTLLAASHTALWCTLGSRLRCRSWILSWPVWADMNRYVSCQHSTHKIWKCIPSVIDQETSHRLKESRVGHV